MKKILAVVAALSMIGTAYAQNDGGNGMGGMGGMVNIEGRGEKAPRDQRHMIDFNAATLPSLVYSFTKSKTKGTNSDNDTELNFGMNYAYAFHPNVQLGGFVNYFNGISANKDSEELLVGAKGWFNFKGGDLQNSPYISAAVGAGYAQTFGAGGSRDDLIYTAVALGKRFSMERWGVKALTWSPEIALTNLNSTANTSFDYRQATELRLLNFSVIW